MAVPKKRTTPSSRGQRRSHDALKPVTMIACANCGQPVAPHHLCQACGFYRGKQIIKV